MAWRSYGNKYGNNEVIVDGKKFQSKKEASRWFELKMLEKAKNISQLERQKKFILIPAQYEPDIIGPRGGRKKGRLLEHECSYIADFYYFDEDTQEYVVEDTKGFRTEKYIIKRKMLLYLYGIRIREV